MLSKSSIFAAVGVAVLLSGGALRSLAQAPAAVMAQPLASADAAAAEIFRESGSTAMVLVVVRGTEVHLQGFGEVAPGSGRGPAPNSLLRLCSLTKIFATDLLVKLGNEGKVRLTDPLQRYAPEGVRVPTRTSQRVMTVGDLATHTAGLPREMGGAPAGTAAFTFPDFAQRWAWLPRQRLRSVPGRAAVYSNVGFDLLGDALAAAAQKPYAELLAERTTRLLGMSDTTFSPSAEQCSRLLIGHFAAEQASYFQCADTRASAGSGGLYSTPNDMARWLQYLLRTSADAALRQSPAAQAGYIDPVSLVSEKGLDHAGEPTAIGLGWMLLGTPGEAGALVQKTGGGGGFTTYIALDPATHTGIFMALTAGEHWGHANSFLAANNLLLALSGLPPMPVEARKQGPVTRSVARRRADGVKARKPVAREKRVQRKVAR